MLNIVSYLFDEKLTLLEIWMMLEVFRLCDKVLSFQLNTNGDIICKTRFQSLHFQVPFAVSYSYLDAIKGWQIEHYIMVEISAV